MDTDCQRWMHSRWRLPNSPARLFGLQYKPKDQFLESRVRLVGDFKYNKRAYATDEVLHVVAWRGRNSSLIEEREKRERVWEHEHGSG